MGFNFIQRSSRFITPSELTSWWNELDRSASRVALFQDASSAAVEAVLNQLDIDILQFHGQESAEFCSQFGKPYWKSIGLPMSGSALGESFTAAALAHPQAAALLLDSVTVDAAGKTLSGGTGKQFDWALWPCWATEKLILAGGLDADNVATAVRALRPWAVDVSSGVESAPGRKDHDKIRNFCAAIFHEHNTTVV